MIPDFHPHVDGQLSPDFFDEQGDKASVQAAALGGLNASLNAIIKARKDIMADDSQTPQGKLLRLDQLYQRNVVKGLDRVRLALTQSYHYRDECEAQANKVLAPSALPHMVGLYSEIRTAFRSASAHERMAMIDAALEGNDRETVVAALHGPAYQRNDSSFSHHTIRDAIARIADIRASPCGHRQAFQCRDSNR